METSVVALVGTETSSILHGGMEILGIFMVEVGISGIHQEEIGLLGVLHTGMGTSGWHYLETRPLVFCFLEGGTLVQVQGGEELSVVRQAEIEVSTFLRGDVNVFLRGLRGPLVSLHLETVLSTVSQRELVLRIPLLLLLGTRWALVWKEEPRVTSLFLSQ